MYSVDHMVNRYMMYGLGHLIIVDDLGHMVNVNECIMSRPGMYDYDRFPTLKVYTAVCVA